MTEMKLSRRAWLAGTTAALAAPTLARALDAKPIRIGEINSYSAVPAFTLPYRNGWQLALINKEKEQNK
jgi:branched-chain amino acid transport system substrate-binding protein